ncbi:MAG: hypothetical protein ACE14S_02415 [Candidatus Bathyarchaeia archaeon]
MTKTLAVPDREEFCRLVQLHGELFGEGDRAYHTALESFRNAILSAISDCEMSSMLRLFLLKWGRMGRVVGTLGCERIASKLREMAPRLSEFRHLTIATSDLDRFSRTASDVYEDLLNTEWKSKKGRTKRVGPTATSKVLHIVAPDFFVMWDRSIRRYYGFRDDGREYVRFLTIMKCWLEKLQPVIAELSATHQRSPAKLIDEYNWLKCRGK